MSCRDESRSLRDRTRLPSASSGDNTHSIPFNMGRRQPIDASVECFSARMHRLSIPRTQKKSQGLSASTRRALSAALLLGGVRSFQGSILVSINLLLVRIDLLVFA